MEGPPVKQERTKKRGDLRGVQAESLRVATSSRRVVEKDSGDKEGGGLRAGVHHERARV